MTIVEKRKTPADRCMGTYGATADPRAKRAHDRGTLRSSAFVETLEESASIQAKQAAAIHAARAPGA
jgi:hypothetical protein